MNTPILAPQTVPAREYAFLGYWQLAGYQFSYLVAFCSLKVATGACYKVDKQGLFAFNFKIMA